MSSPPFICWKKFSPSLFFFRKKLWAPLVRHAAFISLFYSFFYLLFLIFCLLFFSFVSVCVFMSVISHSRALEYLSAHFATGRGLDISDNIQDIFMCKFGTRDRNYTIYGTSCFFHFLVIVHLQFPTGPWFHAPFSSKQGNSKRGRRGGRWTQIMLRKYQDSLKQRGDGAWWMLWNNPRNNRQ